MEQVLATFGIDWRLLLINAANFGLLVFVLWYFLYEPVIKMLRERQERVTRGVRDAEEARKKLAEVEAARATTLAKAGKEADELLLRAREAGARKEEELAKAGEAAARAIVEEAGAQARELKTQALEESRHEVAKLIVLGMEKAFNKKS